MAAEQNYFHLWQSSPTIGSSLKIIWEMSVNVIPFSTKDAPKKSSPAWKNSVERHVVPLIRALEPRVVVWLGKNGIEASKPHLPRDVRKIESVVVNRLRSLPDEEKLAEFRKFLLKG